MSTKATVGPKGASVLDQADSDSARVLKLSPGSSIDILGDEGDYYRIRVYGTNRDFFIAKESVEAPDDYGDGKASRPSRARTKRSPVEAASRTPPSYRRESSGRNHALSASSLATLHDPFFSNPFRILRLAAGVSSQDIRKRADDLRIDARLSSSSDSGLRVEALTRAQADLLDPAKRVLFEAMWFYEPPAPLFDGQVAAGDAELERYRVRVEAPGDEGVESRHDIAVWLLLQAIHTEDIHAAQNLTTRALNSLSELLDDPRYLKYAARFGARTPERTRHLIWQEAISALSVAAQRSAERGAYEQVLAYYGGARDYGIETEDERNLLGLAIQVIVFSVGRVVDAAEKGVPPEGSAVLLFDEWAAQLDRDLSQAVRLYRELGETAFPELASPLDAAALLLRSTAIDLHNDRDETECAFHLTEQALAVVASEHFKDMLTTDLRKLGYQYHMGRCVTLVHEKRRLEAGGAARAALNWATTPEERRVAGDALAALTARRSGTGSGLGPLVGWVARVAVLALIGLGIFAARGGFSSDSSPASSPVSSRFEHKRGEAATRDADREQQSAACIS